MPRLLLTNVTLCAGFGLDGREYVPNSGRIAGVSDHVDLRVDTDAAEGRAETLDLDGPGVDREIRGQKIGRFLQLGDLPVCPLTDG